MKGKIFSGGQTGVDRAALDTALEQGIPCGGWCPKGRLAEDGIIDHRYPLQETPSADYAQRTEWNVRDSDGTLILYLKPMSGGTAYTEACAKKHGKPCLIFEMNAPIDRKKFQKWMKQNQIQILNVAGPRESHAPGLVYRQASGILKELFA